MIHDVEVAGVAEHPVAFPGGQLLDDTELLQVAKRLVDRRRGEAELPDQRARGGEGVRQQRLVEFAAQIRCPVDGRRRGQRRGDEGLDPLTHRRDGHVSTLEFALHPTCLETKIRSAFILLLSYILK